MTVVDKQSWWALVSRTTAGLLLLGLAVGWGVDRMQWQESLQPLQIIAAEKQAELDALQARMYQIETFDGFDSLEEVLHVIDYVQPESVFEKQSHSLHRAEDPVFDVTVPRLIEMLDDEQSSRRQRAWRLLQVVRGGKRFVPYEKAYRDGLAKMLHRRSVVGFNKLLPWLRDAQVTDKAILDGLRSRMMDDEDRFAPMAAYTLAELDPTVDIGPRLIEMIESKHSQWRSILHRLPKYMPQEQADALFEKYQDFR